MARSFVSRLTGSFSEGAAENPTVAMVEAAYRHGQALNMAAHLEIDDVIDPAETRDRVLHAFAAAPAPEPRTTRKRPGSRPGIPS